MTSGMVMFNLVTVPITVRSDVFMQGNQWHGLYVTQKPRTAILKFSSLSKEEYQLLPLVYS